MFGRRKLQTGHIVLQESANLTAQERKEFERIANALRGLDNAPALSLKATDRLEANASA